MKTIKLQTPDECFNERYVTRAEAEQMAKAQVAAAKQGLLDKLEERRAEQEKWADIHQRKGEYNSTAACERMEAEYRTTIDSVKRWLPADDSSLREHDAALLKPWFEAAKELRDAEADEEVTDTVSGKMRIRSQRQIARLDAAIARFDELAAAIKQAKG